MLKGPFTYDGIHEFLRDLSFGRGSTEPMRKPELPDAKAVKKWDGKDAEVRFIDFLRGKYFFSKSHPRRASS